MMSRNKREGCYAGVASGYVSDFKPQHVRYGGQKAYKVRSVHAFSVLKTRADQNALKRYRRERKAQQK